MQLGIFTNITIHYNDCLAELNTSHYISIYSEQNYGKKKKYIFDFQGFNFMGACLKFFPQSSDLEDTGQVEWGTYSCRNIDLWTLVFIKQFFWWTELRKLLIDLAPSWQSAGVNNGWVSHSVQVAVPGRARLHQIHIILWGREWNGDGEDQRALTQKYVCKTQ